MSKRVRGAAKSHQQRAQRRYAAIEREAHLQKIADALRFSALRVEPPNR